MISLLSPLLFGPPGPVKGSTFANAGPAMAQMRLIAHFARRDGTAIIAGDELADQLRLAEDPGADAQGCAGQSVEEMPLLRADAVPPRIGGQPRSVPPLRPSFPHRQR